MAPTQRIVPTNPIQQQNIGQQQQIPRPGMGLPTPGIPVPGAMPSGFPGSIPRPSTVPGGMIPGNIPTGLPGNIPRPNIQFPGPGQSK